MTNSTKQPMLTEQQQTRLLSTIRKEKLVEWGKQPELYNVQDEEDLARICVMVFEMPASESYGIRLFASKGNVHVYWKGKVRCLSSDKIHMTHHESSKTLFATLLEWWHSVREFGTVQVYKSGDGR